MINISHNICVIFLFIKLYLYTGNKTLDNLCLVLLSTPMVLGGIIGFFFDNTIRGYF